jgi:hypothetical protein
MGFVVPLSVSFHRCFIFTICILGDGPVRGPVPERQCHLISRIKICSTLTRTINNPDLTNELYWNVGNSNCLIWFSNYCSFYNINGYIYLTDIEALALMITVFVLPLVYTCDYDYDRDRTAIILSKPVVFNRGYAKTP